MSPHPVERAHLRIHGVVQGVFYRKSCQTEAARLGLSGWVRNRRDGTVEAVAEGPRATLDAWVAWCRGGPTMARVDRVEVVWLPHTDAEPGFALRPTA